MRDGGEPGRGRSGLDGGGELVSGQRGRDELPGRTCGVETEDGMEVNQATGLELGHLRVRQLHGPGAMRPRGAGHAAADRDSGAAP